MVRPILRATKAFVRGDFRRNSSESHGNCMIPQAVVEESNLQSFEVRDWRKHFSSQLSGKGLEIGPLHRPMVRHDGMDIDYIDRCTVAELREHYPELEDLPLVEPDIIGDAENLKVVDDSSYDFLISAHVIEHMKNPLASMEHWCSCLLYTSPSPRD